MGIETLKKVLLTLTEFGVKVEEALSDGKLQLGEAISLGVFIAPKAISHAGEIQEIKAEFKDLDAAEVDELVAYIADKLDLENDLIEDLIEAVIEWADATNDLRLSVQAIIKKDE